MSRWLKNRPLLGGSVLVAFILAVALLGPCIAPHSVSDQDLRNRLEQPTASHLFGTDTFGRDVFSRVIVGSRISLAVGLIGVLVGGSVGTTLGMIAGYSRGKWVDLTIMRVVDLLMCFPTLILGILIISVTGTGTGKTAVAVAVAYVARYIRLARGQVLSLREMEYVAGAHAIGASKSRVLFRHVLPNISTALLTMSTLWLGGAVVIESSLSFLGLGAQPPLPSWGLMIKEGTRYITTKPLLVVFPGIAIALTVYAFVLLGDGIQDLLDPKMRGKSVTR